jgi:hypothetical protein
MGNHAGAAELAKGGVQELPEFSSCRMHLRISRVGGDHALFEKILGIFYRFNKSSIHLYGSSSCNS